MSNWHPPEQMKALRLLLEELCERPQSTVVLRVNPNSNLWKARARHIFGKIVVERGLDYKIRFYKTDLGRLAITTNIGMGEPNA